MRLLNLLFVFLFVSLTAFSQKTIKMEIKEHTTNCIGVAPMECLLVKDGKDWSAFYNHIEGFEYEPGYRYKLKVIRTDVANPPADGSAYHYQLKKIIKKKAVKVEEYLDKKLILTQLNGKAIDKTSFYGIMNSKTGSFSGKSGCNRFNSGFLVDKKKVTFTQGLGTLMACEPELMALEGEFNKTLGGNTFKVTYDGKELKLTDIKDKRKSLVFKVQTVNDQMSFIDKKDWKLISLDNVSKDYGKASVRFDMEEGRVSGNAGCNNFFGSFTVDGNQISMPALATTRMACLDEDRSNTEQKVLGYLSNESLRFDVADQTLNFYVEERLVMIFGWVSL